MLIATLGDAGEGRGEGCSVGDMVKAGGMGWEEYRQRVRVKRARKIVHAATSWKNCHRRLDQLMAAIDHPISLADSAKMKSIDSYPYTVKLSSL
jgi:hypothetical protein